MTEQLIEIIESRAAFHPSKRAFSFLRDSDSRTADLTYSQLASRAKCIAAELQARVPSGARALLVFPPGLEFIEAFFGCLYAGVTAVPVSPPRRNRSTRFLRVIADDCSPAVVLCPREQLERWQTDLGIRRLNDACGTPWIASDTLESRATNIWRDPAVNHDSLALLQYTSGSTSEPRGVMVRHRNLLSNSELIQQAFGTGANSEGVFWLPLYHDMGLIGGVIQTVYCGGSSTLLAPATFLQRPLLWLQTISQRRGSVSGGPDFAYDLCVRRATRENCAGLDLSDWRLAFTGAENIRADTLDRFTETFAPYGFRRESFYPCYGLAEATLMASGGVRDAAPVVLHVDSESLAADRVVEVTADFERRRTLVGCGPSLPGQRIEIVEPGGVVRCGEGRVGEVLIAGPSVADGYYNRGTSDSPFGTRLGEHERDVFVRTGDLGFLRRGELFITGRIKELIVIRGQNFYPQDIEQTAQAAHVSFRPRCCAAFSIQSEGQERLVIVQEIDPRQRNVESDAAIAAVREAVVRDHDVSVFGVVLVRAGAIPRTSSNKIQRFVCRQQFLDDSLSAIAKWVLPPDSEPAAAAVHSAADEPPRSAEDIETWLAQRIAARLRVGVSSVGVTTPFTAFGMSSLDAVEITAELESWVGRRLSPTAVYNYPTISALAERLALQSRETVEIESAELPAAGNDRLMHEVLSLSQEEMETFILQEMAKQEE